MEEELNEEFKLLNSKIRELNKQRFEIYTEVIEKLSHIQVEKLERN